MEWSNGAIVGFGLSFKLTQQYREKEGNDAIVGFHLSFDLTQLWREGEGNGGIPTQFKVDLVMERG